MADKEPNEYVHVRVVVPLVNSPDKVNRTRCAYFDHGKCIRLVLDMTPSSPKRKCRAISCGGYHE